MKTRILAHALFGLLAAGCVDQSIPGATPGSAESASSAENDGQSGAGQVSGDTTSQETAATKPAWQPDPFWFQPSEFGDLYGSVDVRFSENAALVMAIGRYGSVVFGADDGESFGHVQDLHEAAVDAGWQRAIGFTAEQTVRIRSLDGGSGDVMLPFPSVDGELTPWLHDSRVALSGAGDTAAAVMCFAGPQDATAVHVAAWDVAAESLVSDVQLDIPCPSMPWTSPGLALVPDLSGVVVAVPDNGVSVAHVDFQTGVTTTVSLPAPEIGDTDLYYGPVLSIAVAPDGGQVAIGDRSGTVRRLTLPGLQPVGEPLDAGFFVVNKMSYGPSVELPLAWSPDGALLAFTDAEGDVALFDIATESVIATLERPLTDEPLWNGQPNPGHLMGLGFSPDGLTLVAVGEAGTMAWTAVEPTTLEGSRNVAVVMNPPVDGPNGTVELSAVATGFADAALHRLVINGEPLNYGVTFGAALSFWTNEPGAHEVAIEVTDGIDTARSQPITLVVTGP